MSARIGELSGPVIKADSSALFRESILPDTKIYPDDLLELRASITGSADKGKLKAVSLAFRLYQEKHPSPSKEESEVENLIDLQEPLQVAIENLARAIEKNVVISQAKQAVLDAYQKFEAGLEKEQKESDENKKLNAAIRALEIGRAENVKYQAIHAALEEFEKELGSAAAEEALQGGAAEKLRKSIKALEPKRTDYWRYLSYFGIVLLGAIILAICFLTIPFVAFLSTALPWILLVTGLGLAVNYTRQSFNFKVTAGRGLAILIALATAVVAFISMQSVFILPVAILFATGCFLANLILFRANVPKVLNDLVNGFKRPGRITRAKLTRFLYRSIMVLAGVITGFVLTVGMWHSWLAVFPVVGALGILSAPYIFYPLMIVVFIANSAFVYRGLTRFVDSLINCLKVYKNGLLLVTGKDGKDKYVILKPEDGIEDKHKTYRGLWAVLAYFVELQPSDSVGRVILKSIFYVLPKLALVALIASISQIAVVNMNMSSIGEVLPFLQGVAINIIQCVAYAAAYSSRISFIMTDLLMNVAIFMSFICNKEKRTAFFSGIKQSFSSQGLGNLIGAFQELVKEQTQDHAIIDVWRATAGDNWKLLWKFQIKVDWREASFLKKSYCLFKAVIISAIRFFSFPAIICNTVSNAYIATYNASSSAGGLFATPSKATLGGTASAGLVFFSAYSLSEEQNKKMSSQVSSDKIVYKLKTDESKEAMLRVGTETSLEQQSLSSPLADRSAASRAHLTPPQRGVRRRQRETPPSAERSRNSSSFWQGKSGSLTEIAHTPPLSVGGPGHRTA